MSEKETKQEKKEEKTKSAKGKEKEEKSKKKPLSSTKKFLIFCAILVILFLALVIIPGIIKKANLEKYAYNNFEFVKKDDGFWYTMIQKGAQPYWVPFYYHPTELEDIPVEPGLRAKFFEIRDNGGRIFITLDPDAENNSVVVAGVEISRITGSRYDLLNVPTQSAFIKPPRNATTDTGTPIVTCMNSNNQTMVIWITLSDLNVISSKNYCVVLEARTYGDMIRAADRLMYHLLGIMN